MCGAATAMRSDQGGARESGGPSGAVERFAADAPASAGEPSESAARAGGESHADDGGGERRRQADEPEPEERRGRR